MWHPSIKNELFPQNLLIISKLNHFQYAFFKFYIIIITIINVPKGTDIPKGNVPNGTWGGIKVNDKIIIKGAKEHNLKNINLEIPRDKLVVLTGLSGSRKVFSCI